MYYNVIYNDLNKIYLKNIGFLQFLLEHFMNNIKYI